MRIRLPVVIPLIVFGCLILTGCFEEQKSYDTDIEGVWVGTLLLDKGGSIGVHLLVSPDDRCYLVVSDPTSYISERFGGYGVFNVENGYLTSSIKVYGKNGKPTGEMNIVNGRIESNGEREFIAQYSSDDDYLGSGEIFLSVDDSYNMNSSLTKIAGEWNFYMAGSDTVIFINGDNGSISGSDSNGHTFDGSISVIDSKHNLYDINPFMISNWSEDKNGTYKGLATLMDENHMLMALVKIDETYGFIIHLGKI